MLVSSEPIVVPSSDAKQRIDQFLATAFPDQSRAHFQKLLQAGRITVNSRRAKASERLKGGEEILVDEPEAAIAGMIATPMDLDVVFETPDVLVVNKPAGLVVHPAPGHAADTLVNALLARYPGLTVGDTERPGIVHRLDKGTSGLMVVAKTDRAYQSLIRQMQQHTILKEYLALAHGQVQAESGVIEAAIGRHPTNRQRMAIVPEGRPARTHFRVLRRWPDFTLLRLRLETGRTHQIRVHLAGIGHPVAGDIVYGPHEPALELFRPFLHAARLGFELPDGENCAILAAPIPVELDDVLHRLTFARERLAWSPSTF